MKKRKVIKGFLKLFKVGLLCAVRGVGRGGCLTVIANHLGLAAHHEGFLCGRWKHVKWQSCLYDDADTHGNDNTAAVSRPGRQRRRWLFLSCDRPREIGATRLEESTLSIQMSTKAHSPEGDLCVERLFAGWPSGLLDVTVARCVSDLWRWSDAVEVTWPDQGHGCSLGPGHTSFPFSSPSLRSFVYYLL